ncbi:MAG: molybdate ABC transporter permease subunit [Bacillaceae bacterium]|nr:molybdate ABC transporter permease subunit [Bacillaceae bacterium]
MLASFWDPIFLSLRVATISTVMVLIIAVFMGWWLARRSFAGKTVIETLFMLPLVLPPSVVGFALLVLLGNNSPLGQWMNRIFDVSLIFSFPGAVIAAGVVAFPLVYQSVKTGYHAVDRDLESVARSDGASNWQVFLYISLPLSWRFILTGATLGFARALGEFGATLMVAGNIPGKTQTVPTAIYIAVESGRLDMAWYWTLSMVFISFVMLLFIQRLQKNN